MPLPEHAIFVLAETYGQSPQTVREWPIRDQNLAILKLEGEALKYRREDERRKKQTRNNR